MLLPGTIFALLQTIPPEMVADPTYQMFKELLEVGASPAAVGVIAWRVWNGTTKRIKNIETLLFGDPTADPPKPGVGARLARIEAALQKLVEREDEEGRIEEEVQRRLRVHVAHPE